jgi:zinc transport system substrate-binding protein
MSRRPALPLIALTATAAAVSLLSACDSGAGAAGSGGKVDVVASFYPMQYLAEEVGGDRVQVADLTSPGVEPHDLELSPRQVGAVENADLVVYLKGLQPAVDEAVAQAAPAHVVQAAAISPLVDHHLDEGATEEAAGGGGATGDPHLWLDPTRYAAVARGVGEKLAETDPDHAAEYRKNAAALADRLARLDQEFRTGLAPYRGKEFITSHAAFGYLADRYGITQVAINGVDPESEPSPARLAAIQRTARAHGVSTIFFETLTSPKLAKTLASDLGLKTAVLDPIEGVSDPAENDYFSVQQQNLKNLQAAFRGTE